MAKITRLIWREIHHSQCCAVTLEKPMMENNPKIAPGVPIPFISPLQQAVSVVLTPFVKDPRLLRRGGVAPKKAAGRCVE